MTETLFIRPLIFDENVEQTEIDTQFFVGDILVCPVLGPGSSIRCVMPKGHWCKTSFPYDCMFMEKTKEIELPVSMDSIPSFYRDGIIYPLQKPEMTISQTLKNPLEILVVFRPQAGEEVLQDRVVYFHIFGNISERFNSLNPAITGCCKFSAKHVLTHFITNSKILWQNSCGFPTVLSY